MKLHICATCTPQSAALIDAAAAALPDLTVCASECMSGCTRAQTIAFREEGKTAYLFGEITQADFSALETFSIQYAASHDGTFADARALGDLRHKAIARIPA